MISPLLSSSVRQSLLVVTSIALLSGMTAAVSVRANANAVPAASKQDEKSNPTLQETVDFLAQKIKTAGGFTDSYTDTGKTDGTKSVGTRNISYTEVSLDGSSLVVKFIVKDKYNYYEKDEAQFISETTTTYVEVFPLEMIKEVTKTDLQKTSTADYGSGTSTSSISGGTVSLTIAAEQETIKVKKAGGESTTTPLPSGKVSHRSSGEGVEVRKKERQLVVSDATTADKIIKALKHASELCKKKELF